MNMRFADFEDRYVFSAARAWNAKTKEMYILESGYKVTVPTSMSSSTFLSLEGRSNVKHTLFMLKVTCTQKAGDIFESDIVDYSVEDIFRSAGVVLYDKENFRWVVQDTKDEKRCVGFNQCKVNRVLGNIYENEKFLNYELKNIYKALKLDFDESPAPQKSTPASAMQYAALEEDIPGLSGKPEPLKPIMPQIDASSPRNKNATPPPAEIAAPKKVVDVFIYYRINSDRSGEWEYKLQSPDGKHVQEKSGTFNKVGDESYYMVATAIIALNKLSRPYDRVNVHTKSKILNDVLNNMLGVWKKTNWRKADGTEVNHKDMLIELDGIIEKLGRNVQCQMIQ